MITAIEGVEQPGRADRRVEVRAHAEIKGGDGDDDEREAGGVGEDAPGARRPSATRGHRIVRGGAEGAAERPPPVR